MAIQLETPSAQAQIPLNTGSSGPSLSAVRHFANPSEAYAGHGDVDPVAPYLQRLGDATAHALGGEAHSQLEEGCPLMFEALLSTPCATRTTRQRQSAHVGPLVPVSLLDEEYERRG